MASTGEALPLRVLVEPTPGKSHALNRALAAVETDLIAMVDDDHRVQRDYLQAIAHAAATHPAATLFCGRILPDWDGSEPAWVHRPAPFPIYPLPVPHYERGPKDAQLGLEGPLPGGGNLVLRQGVFGRVGDFAIDLGPTGHNLGGGEDIEFVQRAMLRNEHVHYCPAIVQYHYVDGARFTIPYLVRKAYERSRSAILVRSDVVSGIPKYFFKKGARHLFGSVFSLYWPERRFHLVRAAATLGEMRGLVATGRTRGTLS
jgi:glycosyltransferase involved in cell wall biosynthesis